MADCTQRVKIASRARRLRKMCIGIVKLGPSSLPGTEALEVFVYTRSSNFISIVLSVICNSRDATGIYKQYLANQTCYLFLMSQRSTCLENLMLAWNDLHVIMGVKVDAHNCGHLATAAT